MTSCLGTSSRTRLRRVSSRAIEPRRQRPSTNDFSYLRLATALIELFLIEKAAYEIGYEAGNRPAWIGIPLRGLIMLAKRLLKRRGEKVDA